jgi:hypothetical protein
MKELNIYIYIYIYVCVCVRASVCFERLSAALVPEGLRNYPVNLVFKALDYKPEGRGFDTR